MLNNCPSNWHAVRQQFKQLALSHSLESISLHCCLNKQSFSSPWQKMSLVFILNIPIQVFWVVVVTSHLTFSHMLPAYGWWFHENRSGEKTPSQEKLLNDSTSYSSQETPENTQRHFSRQGKTCFYNWFLFLSNDTLCIHRRVERCIVVS